MQKVIALSLLLLGFLLMQSCHRKAVPTLPEEPKTLDIEEIDFGYLHSKARMIFKDEKKEIAAQIEKNLNCEMCGSIGHVFVFFRQNKDPEKRIVQFN